MGEDVTLGYFIMNIIIYLCLFIHFVILFIVTKVSLLGKVSVQTCLCRQVVFGLMLLVKR